MKDAKAALERTEFNPELPERIKDSLLIEMLTKPTRYDLKDGLVTSIWKLLVGLPFFPSFCCPSCCRPKQDEPWFEREKEEKGWCSWRVNWQNNDMLKVMVLSPIKMAKDLENLDYLTNMISELKEPALEGTWRDGLETWMSVRDLTSVMRTEMCQIVLQCIFSDPEVIDGLAFVERFMDVAGPPPPGVLTKMKQTLGAHMKSRAYMYIQELKTEVAHINRIRELQNRLVNLTGTLIMSALIGLANFTSRYIYHQYYDT
eukprot:FR741278.1.p1 GENE.FR741278.1~~FR741278.1.p1  ORF type:complete len:284 (+),score=44.54 FR741278.1:78-854(+)